MNARSEANLNPEDYQRMAQAIAFLQQHQISQPDLATIAQQVNLSEFYFQRLFTRWAGISPKRFLQNLTIEQAKRKIAQSNLLDLSIDLGLSSPGRLHDLFVNLEAMSPGEFKSGGAGLQIRYGLHDSPFGRSLIATTARGICNLHFLDADRSAETLLRQDWPNAEIHFDPTVTEAIAAQIFQPAGLQPPLTLHVKGTNFQIQVWRALLDVRFGDLTTYQSLAGRLNRPTAARAIGNAVGDNPIAYLIPCHRVIRASGELGGYRWGLDRKRMMLGWEAGRSSGELGRDCSAEPCQQTDSEQLTLEGLTPV
ncbi:methylated-DNA--[protein]-cysteine S-methyltransferase [Microcoleus sp. FACHB-1515]|uniref:methylated-DNA--[protein]-cysteine S-methyltransferase n=1 Tax=Cyanophyceae TaxID=3028117 RepID=UPI0016861DA8|nr:methylated-DNA--[protein]-cysteine S-methyltransferase [Microcoleus sp. FACHB-1515]MBD2090128.1 methylated-DNA--[protein]-cysteine S-methyltransferase [Microcoleus sp. FACHB-1515]